MVARLIAAAVALVIAGGPVISAACQGLCAKRVSDRTTTEHHSCHQQPASTGATIDSLPHLCGHRDEGPSAVGQAAWLLTAPAIVESPVTLTPVMRDTLQSPGADNDISPPLLSSLLTPLRV